MVLKEVKRYHFSFAVWHWVLFDDLVEAINKRLEAKKSPSLTSRQIWERVTQLRELQWMEHDLVFWSEGEELHVTSLAGIDLNGKIYVKEDWALKLFEVF